MDQFCLVPSLVHCYCVRLRLSDLLALNDYFSLLDALEEVQKLRVLEPRIGIIHHNFKHRVGAIQDIGLFFLIGEFSSIEGCIHFELILPLLCLLIDPELVELLLHLPLLRLHGLLGVLPLHLLHHHLVLLLGQRFIILGVHHLVQLCAVLHVLLCCIGGLLLAEPQPWFIAWNISSRLRMSY